MIIQSIELERVDRAMTKSVGTSLGRTDNTSGYLVRIKVDSGETGLGWAHENPYITGETADSIHSVIRDVITPFFIGKCAWDIAVLMEGIEKRLVFNYRAKAAVDMALHDLVSAKAGLPLYRYLGGAARPFVECVRMIGLDTPDEMSIEVEEMLGNGFRHFKLKIDGMPADADRIRAVSEVIGEEGRIIVDANQAYTPKQIIQLVNRLHDCPALTVLEQPVSVDDIDGLALVRRSVDILVEADESIRTVGDAYRILEKNAADLISLKVPKMGGIYWTKKIADLCQSAGVPNLVGANVGSCIIDLVHTHFACSHPNVSAFAAEIGESLRLVNDVATGLQIENGLATPTSSPGIGATLLPRAGA
jgi:L-alanine-DL-glutamate epimerase-like enolase superfamily enzyme